MNRDLPNPKFDEKEVDHLIADYGVKPLPKRHQELQKSLEKQMENFFIQKRERSTENNERS